MPFISKPQHFLLYKNYGNTDTPFIVIILHCVEKERKSSRVYCFLGNQIFLKR